MKKYSVAICLLVSSMYANKEYVSYSYYDTAPILFIKPHNTSGNYFVSLDAHVTHSYDSESLARYFSPFDKKQLIVKEDVTADNVLIDEGGQDILSSNFNVVTLQGKFESTLTFKPTKKVWGFTCDISMPIKESWSVNISLPFLSMKTDMGLEEDIIVDGGGSMNDLTEFNVGNVIQFSNMKEAFASSVLKYGKIDGKRSKKGLSDIVVKLYKEYANVEDNYSVSACVGVILPTSNKPKAEYMFEPILGNGQHAGIMTGIEFEKLMLQRARYDLSLQGLCSVSYLFSNHQMRSIDPSGKPWGRYMAMFADDAARIAQEYSFGINECTRKVTVKPGVRVTYNLSLIARHSSATFKLGYQTYIQAGQRIIVSHTDKQPAIASIETPESQVNPARGINNLLDTFKGEQYYGLHSYEMSTHTAVHPFYMAHQLKMSVGIEKALDNTLYNVELGASIVGGSSNAVPHEWNIFVAGSCSL